MPTILIVDDEKNIRGTLARSLHLEGFTTIEAENGAQGLASLERDDVDLMILDLSMPVLDGLGVLENLHQQGRRLPILVLTAHGSIEKAVRAVRLGAFDFIEKPPAIERILLGIDNALKLGRLETENRRLVEAQGAGGGLIGRSPAMITLLTTIARVAPTSAGVLLLGENGSGKELAARAIHEQSPRRERPLVTVNCAAIPDTLFESELFGHAKGAFTGAAEARRGKFREADGGTLFLDEIGEVPLHLQAKLLRALESGDVERLGGGLERVDVRVIAATNRDLETEVRTGKFREDLYFRLLVVPIRVPPLRERREDIAELARWFLERACRHNRIGPKTLSEDALAVLTAHHWPGNVRELRNVMGRVAILVPEDQVGVKDLGFLRPGSPIPTRPGAATETAVVLPDAPLDLATGLAQCERALIQRALTRQGGNMTRTAEELGLERSHLYKKLKALGIERQGH